MESYTWIEFRDKQDTEFSPQPVINVSTCIYVGDIKDMSPRNIRRYNYGLHKSLLGVPLISTDARKNRTDVKLWNRHGRSALIPLDISHTTEFCAFKL
jgi:hypothetical protein